MADTDEEIAEIIRQAGEIADLTDHIEWLERGLRFIADGKTDQPRALAQQVLVGHVWLPGWDDTPLRCEY